MKIDLHLFSTATFQLFPSFIAEGLKKGSPWSLFSIKNENFFCFLVLVIQPKMPHQMETTVVNFLNAYCWI